ncbi:sensor histidine kinase [Motilimonas cestriensis]|uniref:sensor histidine kinase n=1 Tax=Motilimonas cestriensis TaxID=2742685 RepID=UPI003DA3C25F
MLMQRFSSPFIFTIAILVIALTSSLAIQFFLYSTAAVLLILQLAVVVVALQCNNKFAYLCAVFTAVSFNFLFTAPRFSLKMINLDEIFNLLVFLIVALTTSQLAEHYRRQQNELKQAQLRNSILMSVSHDLRTPLATIIGTLTTLKEYMGKLTETEKTELLTSATFESHRLHQYIENLLHATKLQHGAVKLHKTEESILNLIQHTMTRFPESQHRLHLISEPSLPKLFICHSLIEQAIFNVIDNALRYSPADEIVNLKLYASDGEVVLEVCDKGPGITEQQKQQIFELFYSDSSQQYHNCGTGLGLTVAKGMVMLHLGKIEAVTIDHGCMIRICLPVH